MKTKILSWLAAIALVFAFAFTACDNGGGGNQGNQGNQNGNQAGYDGTPGLAFELINGGRAARDANGNAYRVRKGDVTDGHVKIPAYYNGLPVTEIGFIMDDEGNTAFGRTDITSIEIPETIAIIGGWAFSGCINLTSITIPASVTEIGDNPFNVCNDLKNITVAADNKIYSSEDGILYNKNKTELVAFPSVRGEFIIPDSVTSILGGALAQTYLTNVTIPARVTKIGIIVFYNCYSLESISVDPDNPNYSSENGILYNKAKTEIIQVPGAISDDITIPNSVTTIGDMAFLQCHNLTSVIIPNSVTTISEGAFTLWASSQTINVQGHSTQADADAAWGEKWRKERLSWKEDWTDIRAIIKYWDGNSYQ